MDYFTHREIDSLSLIYELLYSVVSGIVAWQSVPKHLTTTILYFLVLLLLLYFIDTINRRVVVRVVIVGFPS
jgi:hypothetical protein